MLVHHVLQGMVPAGPSPSPPPPLALLLLLLALLLVPPLKPYSSHHCLEALPWREIQQLLQQQYQQLQHHWCRHSQH
jgi:hypothetical protein